MTATILRRPLSSLVVPSRPSSHVGQLVLANRLVATLHRSPTTIPCYSLPSPTAHAGLLLGKTARHGFIWRMVSQNQLKNKKILP